MVREAFARTPYGNAVMAAKDKPLIDEILAKKTNLSAFLKRIKFFESILYY
jgi:hypothetical protein